MSVFPPLNPPFKYEQAPVFLDGWDLARLGHFALPGKTKVVRGNTLLKIDEKPRPGKHGSRPTFHGLHGQDFVIDNICWTDEQREQLARTLKEILPFPKAGQNANGDPLVLDHPSVAHYGFPIVVKVMGASIMEIIAPNTTKVSIMLKHWLAPPDSVNAKPATSTPTKSIRNLRQEKSRQRRNENPTPSNQSNVGDPPNFTPGP